MDKITIKESDYNQLVEKAAKWDSLDEKLSEFYSREEEQEDGLITIGEMCAIAFGYL